MMKTVARMGRNLALGVALSAPVAVQGEAEKEPQTSTATTMAFLGLATAGLGAFAILEQRRRSANKRFDRLVAGAEEIPVDFLNGYPIFSELRTLGQNAQRCVQGSIQRGDGFLFVDSPFAPQITRFGMGMERAIVASLIEKKLVEGLRPFSFLSRGPDEGGERRVTAEDKLRLQWSLTAAAPLLDVLSSLAGQESDVGGTAARVVELISERKYRHADEVVHSEFLGLSSLYDAKLDKADVVLGILDQIGRMSADFVEGQSDPMPIRAAALTLRTQLAVLNAPELADVLSRNFRGSIDFVDCIARRAQDSSLGEDARRCIFDFCLQQAGYLRALPFVYDKARNIVRLRS